MLNYKYQKCFNDVLSFCNIFAKKKKKIKSHLNETTLYRVGDPYGI